MALQIRRGTDAERQLIIPLQGELIFTTDTKKLYVGDGATVGGSSIASYTNEDAQDAAAALFTSGQHTNITFAYNDSLARIDAAVDLAQYNGTITASEFRGSVVADDFTQLINGSAGRFNLSGTVGSHIVADTNDLFDIGSSSYRFKNLYLSGDNIYLGAATIAAVGSSINLPAGSTVNGIEISTGNFSVESDTAPKLGGNLDVNGKSITGTGNIGVTGTISASAGLGGNLDLNGKSITGTGGIDITGTLNLSGQDSTLQYAGIRVNTEGTLEDDFDLLTLQASHNLSTVTPQIFIRSRGTVASPTAVQSGDELGNTWYVGFNTSNSPTITASITAKSSGTITTTAVPGTIEISTADSTGAMKLGLGINHQQIIQVADNTVTAGTSPGQVNTSAVATYLKVQIGSTVYAIPAYAIRP